MPKETIPTDSKPFVMTPDGGEHPVGPGEAYPEDVDLSKVYNRYVHVGWTRQQHVEVGVCLLEASTETVVTGHFTTLDREGINRAIRALRKARDAAFGRDE